MPTVRDEIAHILLHVNAEADKRALKNPGDRAPQRRAQYMRDTIKSLATDDRILTRDGIKQAVRDAAPNSRDRASFLRMWDNAEDLRGNVVGWIRNGSERG